LDSSAQTVFLRRHQRNFNDCWECRIRWTMWCRPWKSVYRLWRE
jgi:hypothetical protein